MTIAGPNNPAAGTDDPIVGSIAWASVANAVSSNDLYTTATFGVGTATTHALRGTSFGFAIPAGANIDGVVVGIERKSSISSNTKDATVRLYTGSYVGLERKTSTFWPTTDTYEDHGSPTDVWGAVLDPTIVNAATFGFGIAVTGSLFAVASIDHVRVTVYYTAAPATGPALSQTIVVGL